MSRPVNKLQASGGRRARLRDRKRRSRPGPSDIGPDTETHFEASDKPLTAKATMHMKLALARNRWRRTRHNIEVEQSRATGACMRCGARPCGHLWDGEKDHENSTQCCPDCTHEQMHGWRHTHTVFLNGSNYCVMGVPGAPAAEHTPPGSVAMVYFRADGVVCWTCGVDGYKRHLGEVEERATIYTAEAVAIDDQLELEAELLSAQGIEEID